MINGTLLVQMINFCIAYGVVHVLLVVPAATILGRAKLDHQDLIDRIGMYQKELYAKNQLYHERWITFQQACEVKNSVQCLNASVTNSITHQKHQLELSHKGDLQPLVDHLATQLIQRIEHDLG